MGIGITLDKIPPYAQVITAADVYDPKENPNGKLVSKRDLTRFARGVSLMNFSVMAPTVIETSAVTDIVLTDETAIILVKLSDDNVETHMVTITQKVSADVQTFEVYLDYSEKTTAVSTAFPENIIWLDSPTFDVGKKHLIAIRYIDGTWVANKQGEW